MNFGMSARALGGALCTAVLAVAPAGAVQVLHVGPASSNQAYLFDWRGGSAATVVTDRGRADGSYAQVGSQRVLSLATPLSQETVVEVPECPELQATARIDVRQIGVSTVSGTAVRGESDVAEAGTVTLLDGCAAGRVDPWGGLDQPVRTRHLAAALRPSLADLVPGSRLAGPSEVPGADDPFPAVDVVSFGSGQITFERSGNAYPTTLADGWLVFAPGGERGYTRFSVDRLSGAETWVQAEWATGQPQRVFQRPMVQPRAGAGFGGLWRTARVWEGGLFVGTPTLFSIHLYRDFTGERVVVDVPTGTETRQPISWAYDGANVVMTRPLGGGTGIRTWQPLRNSGGTRFVMEEETRTLPDGSTVGFIAPRINLYIDRGPAVPPVVQRR